MLLEVDFTLQVLFFSRVTYSKIGKLRYLYKKLLENRITLEHDVPYTSCFGVLQDHNFDHFPDIAADLALIAT